MTTLRCTRRWRPATTSSLTCYYRYVAFMFAILTSRSFTHTNHTPLYLARTRQSMYHVCSPYSRLARSRTQTTRPCTSRKLVNQCSIHARHTHISLVHAFAAHASSSNSSINEAFMIVRSSRFSCLSVLIVIHVHSYSLFFLFCIMNSRQVFVWRCRQVLVWRCDVH
jgi:hypothetical protein